MKKVNTFIREVNLKLCRKLNTVPLCEVAKRFLIDNNAHSFTAVSEDTHANQWGVSIIKNHGKYTITYWKDVWDEQAEDDIVTEKVNVTSDYRKVIVAINDVIGVDAEWNSYDAWSIKDKHLNRVNWDIFRNPSDLYDDEEEINCGELPEGFKPVNELEPVPEEIKINE